MDEALAVGDEFFQRKCFKHLETLKDNGTSILLVTHNCGQILQHCDQAMLLHKGHLEFIGSPKSITTIYQRLINTGDKDWRSQAQKLFAQLEANAVNLIPNELEIRISLVGESSGYDPNLKPESRMSYPSRTRSKSCKPLMPQANYATCCTRVKLSVWTFITTLMKR